MTLDSKMPRPRSSPSGRSATRRPRGPQVSGADPRAILAPARDGLTAVREAGTVLPSRATLAVAPRRDAVTVTPARVTLPPGHRTDARPSPLPGGALFLLPPPSGPVTPRRPAQRDPDRPAAARPPGPDAAPPRPEGPTATEAAETAGMARHRTALQEFHAGTAAAWRRRAWRRLLTVGLALAVALALVLAAA